MEFLNLLQIVSLLFVIGFPILVFHALVKSVDKEKRTHQFLLQEFQEEMDKRYGKH